MGDFDRQSDHQEPPEPIRRSLPGPALWAAISLLIAVGLIFGSSIYSSPAADSEPLGMVTTPRVVILKNKRTLHLFDGHRLIRSYPVDLGQAPVGQKMRKDDGKTPEGTFRVATKNPNSEFFRFIGIDYPDVATSRWGLSKGLISQGEWASIQRAHETGRCPDWATALGGGIGLHGHRKGSDWTGGCVALSDDAVEELFNVLRIGDPVEILP